MNKRPFVGSIERITEQNDDFRRVLFTGEHLQLVVMSLRPGEAIGGEVHDDVDQFFRIEEGSAVFVFAGRDRVTLGPGGAVLVPAGTRHNVVNPSRSRALKLYTLYAPPQHRAGTVQRAPRQRTRRG